MRKIVVKCPKCSRENIYTPTKDDFATMSDAGVARVGFLHDGHILLVDFDSSFFVRGAYITSIHNLHPHTKLYFDSYLIIFSPIVGIRTQLIWMVLENKIIDVRACPSCLAEIYQILNSIIKFIQQYGSKIHVLPRIVGIIGKTFNIIHDDSRIIFSPRRPDDVEYKISWLKILCKNFEIEKLGDNILQNIIAYIDLNGEREPNNDDIENLKKMCTK